MKLKISLISPLYNEAKNIPLLYRPLKEVLEKMKNSYEIIFIDDGSSDPTREEIEKISRRDARVRPIILRKNYGQTAALTAGFNQAKGEIIITIDGDLQNDPGDIPRLLEKIESGYDLVSGWRKNRRDSFLARRLPSMLANYLISKISGVKLHDFGCTLKAYRREIIKDIHLYGEMHRFIPIYASWQGARVAEIVVTHHPRQYGRSKYGLNRIFKVILDLMVIKFLEKYSQKPIYIFGGFGLASGLAAVVSFLLTIYYKFWGGKSFIETPLPVLTIMFALISFISVFLGLLAEIVIRTYFETQKKPTYLVKNQREE